MAQSFSLVQTLAPGCLS